MFKDENLYNELKKEIGDHLKLVDFDILEKYDRNAFSLDENGYITGLNLCKLKKGNMLPGTLKELRRLKKLSLYETKPDDLSLLGDLQGLTGLYLGYTGISDISFLKEMKNLNTLNLSGNNITDISVLKELKNLTSIDLRENNVKELPGDIFDMVMDIDVDDEWDGKGIWLFGNPLEKPPLEIIKKGKEAIRVYFDSINKCDETLPLNEVKVLLMGEGGSGKTSLVKRLLGQGFDKNEPETHGINIETWFTNEPGKKIKTHLWDFGGQEIMHSTHQFFLTKRSLYILLLDGRKDEDAEYWLRHVNSLAGDSPILLVINKIDQNPGFDVNRKFLFEKYPNIKGFYRTSCCTDEGIDHFGKELIGILANIPHLNTTWPRSWFNVKMRLEGMPENFISFEKYIHICAKEGISEYESQHILVDFLNDLGVVLHFHDFGLAETNVINPKWVTEGVYAIINSSELANNKGILPVSALDRILDKRIYPTEKVEYIIGLMKKFELCFSIKDNSILIPDLLAVEEPDFDFDYNSAFKFLICFDFLPKSIIARFIVRMHRDIKDDLRWRTGVVLSDSLYDCIAVVKVDKEDKKLMVFVSGRQAREYFAIIRNNLHDILSNFEKIEFREMVPCYCKECISLKEPHFYEYGFLRKLLTKNKKTVTCGKSIEDISIEALLSGLKDIKKNAAPGTWDVFISYSSGDEAVIRSIVEDLKRYGIKYWIDWEQVKPGSKILDTIESGIKKCRFMMPCFSQNQLKSNWCRAEYEVAVYAKLSGDTDQQIIPLVLDNLDTSELSLFARNYHITKYNDKQGYKVLLRKLRE